MIILGIETSCDETAAAIVRNGRQIKANVIASSVELHRQTGGIIPEVAAREQLKDIIPVIKKALDEAHCQPHQLDALAVTTGPGLIGSLLVGVETAKTLALTWEKPLVPVNHLQAHLYANWLENPPPPLPAIGLVVSGGHTDLVLLKSHSKIIWLGGTRDDAAGECFDKTARLLGLPYPGGPEIAKLAQRGQPEKYTLPRPMIDQDNLDFSFSGLKTAIVNTKKTRKIRKTDLAAGIQEAIAEVLVFKTLRAAKKHKTQSVLLAGGVTANQHLRERFMIQAAKLKIKLFVPPPQLCTDNAAYIASRAFFNYQPQPWSKIQADPSLSIEEMIR